MPADFNQQIIEEFRANQGKVGGPFEGGRLLLLTTTGARSGKPHTVPVAYLPDDGGRVLIIGSAGGAPNHPAWYHNLVANPRVTLENGIATYEADAAVLEGEERDRLFARAVEADRGWGDYQAKVKRVLPMVALTEVPTGGPPNLHAESFGAALKLIHDAFRRELAAVRREIAESGRPGLGAQLRVNCMNVCQGLHFHHMSEDNGIFPAVANQRPDLAPVLERLDQEHKEIAVLIEQLQVAVSGESSDSQAVLAEVERLIDDLERHLVYEEEQLIPALDAMAV